jgi:signal transduction histidine kinase
LETTDLGDLLRYLAQMTIARTKAQVDVQIDLDVALASDVKTAFYRVAQEALNNVFKHAHADHVLIALRNHQGAVLLRISDNGQGFDPAHLPAGHFGINIMDERARMINAALVVDSAPDRGTDVVLTYDLEGA